MLATLLKPGILPFIMYALGIAVLTTGTKIILRASLRSRYAHFKRFETLIPVILGMASAPIVIPFVFTELGVISEAMPMTLSLFAGALCGALSSKLYDLAFKIIAKKAEDLAEDK
jgi:hypothetical protein